MANKKINQLDTRTGAALTDLVLIGDPTSGTSFKLTATDFRTLLNLVPYTGATGNVNLGEFGLSAGQLTLDTTPTGTAAVGTTRWNDTIGSSETTLKGGSVILKNGVDLVARVVNKVSPNTTLTKAAYQAVRVSGAQGQRLAVAFAQANNDANSADTIGLVTETIATNQEGFIITVGQLENINTTGSLQGETWADGDVLYLSPTTPGAITKIKPTGNGHIVVIGYVEYAHANNGKIYVKVMNGWELTELHDCDIVTPLNDQVLTYESATQLWKNKAVSSSNIYTANGTLTNAIRTITGALGGSMIIGNAITDYFSISLYGSLNATDYNFTSSSTDKHLYINAPSGNEIKFRINNIDKLLLGASLFDINYATRVIGNLTIGNSTVSNYQANIFGSTFAYLSFHTTSSGISSTDGFQIGYENTGVYFINRENTFIRFATNNTDRMTLTSAGRLLLGTTTESTYILDAVGSDARINGVFIGRGLGNVSTNTTVGKDSLRSNTTGATNTALGDEVLYSNTTGSSNTGVGYNTLAFNVNGSNNVAIGRSALRNGTGLSANTAIGDNAGLNVTSGNNTIIGQQAGRNLTSGGSNTLVGNLAGFDLTTGANNIVIGNFPFASTIPNNINDNIIFGTSGIVKFRMFDTGNLILQNGGTFTDAGFRLDVNGTARVSDNLTVSKNQNAQTLLSVSNTTSGTASNAALSLTSDASSGSFNAFKTSTTYTTYKILVAKDAGFYNGTLGGDFAFMNDNASGKFKIAVGGSATAQLTLTASGRLLLGTVSESTYLLDVNGNSRISGDLNINNGLTINITANTAQFTYISTAYKINAIGDLSVFRGGGSIGDLSILNDYASGSIKMAAGGSSTAHFTIKSNGRINMSSLPTSATGLSTGDLWNDAGTLKIV